MKFEGIMPALLTPINENSTLREDAARMLCKYQLAEGADGVYVCGATGEGVLLNAETRKAMCEVVIDEVKGKIPVITHVASIDTMETIELAKHAERMGADCVAAVPPFYFQYNEREVYDYYKALASAVSIPVMIYYFPASGAQMDANLVAKLFEIDNITSIKWSSRDYFDVIRLKEMTHGEINVINGPDETLLCGLAAGADGGIGANYNVALPLFKKLYTEFKAGNIEGARKAQNDIHKIRAAIRGTGTLIPALKYVLELRGIPFGEAAFPMQKLSNEQKSKLVSDLKKYPELFSFDPIKF